MNKCIICDKYINESMIAVLDTNHKAHLECWCNLLLDMKNSTEQERKENLKELIEIFIGK